MAVTGVGVVGGLGVAKSVTFEVAKSAFLICMAGITAMRRTLLTADNRVQWDRLLELAGTAEQSAADGVPQRLPAATSNAVGKGR